METKYKIGQTVFFLHDNRVKYKKVKSIHITGAGVTYHIGSYAFSEEILFSKTAEVYKFFNEQELQELK